MKSRNIKEGALMVASGIFGLMGFWIMGLIVSMPFTVPTSILLIGLVALMIFLSYFVLHMPDKK